MRCFVVAGFLLTSASRNPSAIAELLVLSVTVHFIALRLGRAIIHQHTKILLKQVQNILEICFF